MAKKSGKSARWSEPMTITPEVTPEVAPEVTPEESISEETFDKKAKKDEKLETVSPNPNAPMQELRIKNVKVKALADFRTWYGAKQIEMVRGDEKSFTPEIAEWLKHTGRCI